MIIDRSLLFSACSLLENGVVAMFGPAEKNAATHVQSICDSLDMPHIVAHPDIEPLRMRSINLHPNIESLSNVSYKWTRDSEAFFLFLYIQRCSAFHSDHLIPTAIHRACYRSQVENMHDSVRHLGQSGTHGKGAEAMGPKRISGDSSALGTRSQLQVCLVRISCCSKIVCHLIITDPAGLS